MPRTFTTKDVKNIVAATKLPLRTSVTKLRNDLNDVIVGLDLARDWHETMSPKRRINSLNRLRRSAEGILTLLGDDPKLPLIERTSPEPRLAAMLDNAAYRALEETVKKRQSTRVGPQGKLDRQILDARCTTLERWSVEGLIDLLRLLIDLSAKAAGQEPEKGPSPLNWLVGSRLPSAFEKHFRRKFGISKYERKPSADRDDVQISVELGGPGVCFVLGCLRHIGVEMTPEALEKHWDRYRETKRLRGTRHVCPR